ncbi:hypothetical protein QOT17_001710 [Balamuthia mandrillaris]
MVQLSCCSPEHRHRFSIKWACSFGAVAAMGASRTSASCTQLSPLRLLAKVRLRFQSGLERIGLPMTGGYVASMFSAEKGHSETFHSSRVGVRLCLRPDVARRMPVLN